MTYTAPASSSDGSATTTATYRGFTATSTITLRGITFTLTPASATVDADGQSTVSLTLRLRYTSGGAITGASTTVSLSGSGILSPTGSVASSASDITLTYTAPLSESDGSATITVAAYKGFSALASTISFRGVVLNVSALPASIVADGVSTSTITVTFTNTVGSPVVKSVTVSTNQGSWSGGGQTTAVVTTGGSATLTLVSVASKTNVTATITATYSTLPQKQTIVTFTAMGKYRVNATITADNLVERVQTWIPNPVFGDMVYEHRYTEYKDYNGVKFPGILHSHQGDPSIFPGHNWMEVRPTAVTPNVNAPALTVTDAVRNWTIPAARAESRGLANGVWFQ